VSRENRTPGSTGGGWKRNAAASPRQSPTQPTSCAFLTLAAALTSYKHLAKLTT
jgi:hypothetical protein